MRRLLLFCALLGLSGCGTAQFKNTMNSWNGRPVDEYILANQAPDSVYDTADGHKIYTFVTQGSSHYVATSANTAVQIAHSCKVQIYTDAMRIIAGWKAEGNRCR